MWNNAGYGEINNLKCYFKYSSTVVNFKFDFDNLTVEREETDNYGEGFILPIIYSKNADANGNHVYSYLVQENEDRTYFLLVLSSNISVSLTSSFKYKFSESAILIQLSLKILISYFLSI